MVYLLLSLVAAVGTTPNSAPTRAATIGGRPTRGPLTSANSAASALTMATTMIKLQAHMTQLNSAFEGLRGDFEATSSAFKAEAKGLR